MSQYASGALRGERDGLLEFIVGFMECVVEEEIVTLGRTP